MMKSTKDSIVKSSPALKPTEIKTLRYDSKKPQVGTVLRKGRYTIDVSIPNGKTITLVKLGLVFAGENQQMYANRVVRNVNVIWTRSRISFGKVLYSSQTIKIPGNLKVKDLRNLLKSQIGTVSKVTLQFQLVKNVKTSVRMTGCQIMKDSTTPISLIPNYGVVNPQSYMCTTSVNLLPYTDLLSIYIDPNITDYDLLKLRSNGKNFYPGASLFGTPYELTIELPNSQGMTMTKLGIEFPLENKNTNSKSIVSSLTVQYTRMRLSFGNAIYTTSYLTLPNIAKLGNIKNLLQQQLSQIHKIVIRFSLLKKVNVRLVLDGCYSFTQSMTTTRKPLGCLHLNKFYQPNEMIPVISKCDYKMCVDGEILPIFNCKKDWTPWKECSKLCGAGKSTRRQICVLNPKLINVNKKQLLKTIDERCFERIEIKPCFEKPCQASCKYSKWSSWSPCNNNNCKDEYQVRTREELTKSKLARCSEPLMESRRCMKENCSCVKNAEMNNCANMMCPTDCDHMNDRVKCVKAKSGCIRACICKLGYLYQYGRCVPRANCECLKPIFKGWLKGTESKSSTTGSPPKSKTDGSAGGKETGGNKSPGENKTTGSSSSTTKSSKYDFNPISKKDYLEMKNQKGGTPPWLPGTTPRPLFIATPPWFPGTTGAGATVKRATEPPKDKILPPPKGLTASPPDDFGKKQTLGFLVTTRYLFQGNNQGITTKNVPPGNVQPGDPTKTTVPSSISSPSGSNVPSSSQNPSVSSPGSSSTGTQPNTQDINKSSPGSWTQSTSPAISSKHVKASSSLLVDCQTCVCTNGQLKCLGPQCHNGTNTWSDWTDWSPCTAMCGIGFKRRFRQCYGFGCKDKSVPAAGIRRFVAYPGIEAEDKACSVKECSCMYTRSLFRIHIGDDQIKKYNIDLGIAWIEKDNIKGLNSPDERVKQDDVIRSGETVFLKCTKCLCKNGRISCSIDCK